jgi:hypothetical protein
MFIERVFRLEAAYKFLLSTLVSSLQCLNTTNMLKSKQSSTSRVLFYQEPQPAPLKRQTLLTRDECADVPKSGCCHQFSAHICCLYRQQFTKAPQALADSSIFEQHIWDLFVRDFSSNLSTNSDS